MSLEHEDDWLDDEYEDDDPFTLGYYCNSCGHAQNHRTGFGCDQCGGQLDEYYE